MFAFARLYIGGVVGLEIPGPKLDSGPPNAAGFIEGSPFSWLLYADSILANKAALPLT